MLDKIKYFNMKELSLATGVKYSTLRNYSCGRLKELREEDIEKLNVFFDSLGGNVDGIQKE